MEFFYIPPTFKLSKTLINAEPYDQLVELCTLLAITDETEILPVKDISKIVFHAMQGKEMKGDILTMAGRACALLLDKFHLNVTSGKNRHSYTMLVKCLERVFKYMNKFQLLCFQRSSVQECLEEIITCLSLTCNGSAAIKKSLPCIANQLEFIRSTLKIYEEAANATLSYCICLWRHKNLVTYSDWYCMCTVVIEQCEKLYKLPVDNKWDELLCKIAELFIIMQSVGARNSLHLSQTHPSPHLNHNNKKLFVQIRQELSKDVKIREHNSSKCKRKRHRSCENVECAENDACIGKWEYNGEKQTKQCEEEQSYDNMIFTVLLWLLRITCKVCASNTAESRKRLVTACANAIFNVVGADIFTAFVHLFSEECICSEEKQKTLSKEQQTREKEIPCLTESNKCTIDSVSAVCDADGTVDYIGNEDSCNGDNNKHEEHLKSRSISVNYHYDHFGNNKPQIKRNKNEIASSSNKLQEETNNIAVEYVNKLPQFDIAELLNLISILESLLVECMSVSNNFSDPFARESARSVPNLKRNHTTNVNNYVLQTNENTHRLETSNVHSVNSTTTVANEGESDDIETDEMYKEYANTQWIVPELRWSATILLAKFLGVEPKLHNEYLWTWRDGDVYYEYPRKEKEKLTQSFFNGEEEVTSTDGRFVINLANMTATSVRMDVITRVHFQPVPLCSTFTDQRVQFITRSASIKLWNSTFIEKMKETLRTLSFSCTPTAIIAKVLLLHTLCRRLPQNEEEEEDIASVFRSVIADVHSDSLERYAEQLVHANVEWAAILVNQGIIDELSMSAPSLLTKSTQRHLLLHTDKHHPFVNHWKYHVHDLENAQENHSHSEKWIDTRKHQKELNDHKHTNGSTINVESNNVNGQERPIRDFYGERNVKTNVDKRTATTISVDERKHNTTWKNMKSSVEEVPIAKRTLASTLTRNTSTRTSPALAWIREVGSSHLTQNNLSETKENESRSEWFNADTCNKSPSPLSSTLLLSSSKESSSVAKNDGKKRCSNLPALTLPESNVSMWATLLDEALESASKLLRVFDAMALRRHGSSHAQIDCLQEWLGKQQCNRQRVADVLATYLIKEMQKISLEARTGNSLLDTVCRRFTTCTVNIETSVKCDSSTDRGAVNHQHNGSIHEIDKCLNETSTHLEERHKVEHNSPLRCKELEDIIVSEKKKYEEECEEECKEEKESTHLLKMYSSLNWQCNECGCHTGFAALSCRQCNYDVCFQCVQVQTGKLDVSTTATLGDVLQYWRNWHNTDSVDCSEEGTICSVVHNCNDRVNNTNTCKNYKNKNADSSVITYINGRYYHTVCNKKCSNINNNNELLTSKLNKSSLEGDCIFADGKFLLSSAAPAASVRDRLLHISPSRYYNSKNKCANKLNDKICSAEYLTEVMNCIFVITRIPLPLSLHMSKNKCHSVCGSLYVGCVNDNLLTENGWSHLFLSLLCSVAECIAANNVLVHSIMEAIESCGTLIFMYGAHNLPGNLYAAIAVLGQHWSFELKYKLCKFVAIDCYRYAMKHLQDANVTVSGIVHGEVESNGLSCKVKVNREDMSATINTLYCIFAWGSSLRNKMEFQFDGEEGTGSGPTQELYSTLSRYFRSSSKFWAVRDESVDLNETENEHYSSNQLCNDNDIGHDEIHHEEFIIAFPTCLRLYYKEFYVFGALCGRAFIDNYRINVELISEVWSLLRSTSSVNEMLHETENITSTAIWKLFEAIFPSIAHSYKELLEALARSDAKMDYVASYELEDDTGVLITRHNTKAFIAERIMHYLRYGLCNVHAFARGLLTSIDLSLLWMLSDVECSRMLCGSFSRTSHNLTGAAAATSNDNNDDDDDDDDTSKLFSSEQLREAITEAHGYNSDSPQVKMFIRIVGDEFTREQQEHFLEFLTGSSLLPLNGLCGLGRKITVVRKDMEGANEETLPSCNTCFLYFKLPPYSSHEIMKKRLLFAVTEGRRNFSLS